MSFLSPCRLSLFRGEHRVGGDLDSLILFFGDLHPAQGAHSGVSGQALVFAHQPVYVEKVVLAARHLRHGGYGLPRHGGEKVAVVGGLDGHDDVGSYAPESVYAARGGIGRGRGGGRRGQVGGAEGHADVALMARVDGLHDALKQLSVGR